MSETATNLSVGERLFAKFQAKNKRPTHYKLKEKAFIVPTFTIKLKNISKLAKDNSKEMRVLSQDPDKKMEAIKKFRMDLLGIDRIITNEQLEDAIINNMIRQIENEYAQQYLEFLGVGGSD